MLAGLVRATVLVQNDPNKTLWSYFSRMGPVMVQFEVEYSDLSLTEYSKWDKNRANSALGSCQVPRPKPRSFKGERAILGLG